MIELRNIVKSFHDGSEDIQVLKNINLKITRGEFVAIMGTSGSGKSTLMNILGLLDKQTSGEYYLNDNETLEYKGNDLAKLRNEEVGFVFQQYFLLPKETILNNVKLPLIYAGMSSDKATVVSEKALKEVGLADKKNRKPNELSGGQKQRVAIARALVNRPSIILADEPTGALDSKTGKEILDILIELNEKGKTIVMVTHDSEIASYANRVITIKDGEIIKDTTKTELETISPEQYLKTPLEIAKEHYPELAEDNPEIFENPNPIDDDLNATKIFNVNELKEAESITVDEGVTPKVYNDVEYPPVEKLEQPVVKAFDEQITENVEADTDFEYVDDDNEILEDGVIEEIALEENDVVSEPIKEPGHKEEKPLYDNHVPLVFGTHNKGIDAIISGYQPKSSFKTDISSMMNDVVEEKPASTVESHLNEIDNYEPSYTEEAHNKLKDMMNDVVDEESIDVQEPPTENSSLVEKQGFIDSESIVEETKDVVTEKVTTLAQFAKRTMAKKGGK